MNITVLIGSCDKYSYLWDNFDFLFKKYCELNTKKILVSETLTFNNTEYTTTCFGNIPWGERILKSLELVETEYVFFILDDYYFTESLSKDFLQNHIDILEKKGAVKIMMDIDYGYPIYTLKHLEDNLYQFGENSQYLNSVQPAIWKTEYLKKVLKPNYSPWDFELIGNEYTKTLKPIILLNARPKHVYFNIMRKGGILSDGWQDIFKKENLKLI
jgi:hypothetical protein